MAPAKELSYIINHVFLPPKLPQKDDSEYDKDFALGKQCEAALTIFRNLLPAQQHWKWAACTKMIRNLLVLRDPYEGTMLGEVGNSLAEMETNGMEKSKHSYFRQLILIDALAFHIRGQNAGLIIRKLSENFSFESFELSPTTKSLMETKGRLRRCFPGPAIALAHERISDPSFREALAQALTSLDTNTPIEVYKCVSKSQRKHIEVRETVHPKFVTEMLTGMLRGIGRPYDANRIYKRTRDDVLWNNALKPWRRSPFWLLLRVALQTNLAIGGSNHEDYKSFMIFFMAHILQLALQQSVSSETLFLMAAKINRRTQKLVLGDQQTGMHYIQGVVDATHQELAKRWHSIERSPDPLGLCKTWKAARLSFHSDTELSLWNLKPYMDRIWTRAKVPLSASDFSPKSPTRTDWNGRYPYLDRLLTCGDYPTRLSLLDVDLWVQKSLENWMMMNLRSDTACTQLAELIQKYTRTAEGVYADNPEDTSLMLLTTMDLWVALDKCASRQYPLLRMYDPGFPPSLFHPLLLPKRAQMERLIRVEQHIQQRRDASQHPSSLVFKDTSKPDSFAVKYFEQSLYHQALRREIEAAAALERVAKMEELARMTEKYHRKSVV